MAKVSKRYAEVSKLVDRNKTYPIERSCCFGKNRLENVDLTQVWK